MTWGRGKVGQGSGLKLFDKLLMSHKSGIIFAMKDK